MQICSATFNGLLLLNLFKSFPPVAKNSVRLFTYKYFYPFQKLFVVMFMTQISSLLTLNCSNVHQSARKKLAFLRHDFMFVENPSSSRQTTLEIPRRVSRDVTMPGTTKCPWKWALDDNPNRVPRFLTKAVCSFCGHYCRAVLFHHRGLVQRCDVKTGETVWKWVQVKLPVAFVYDSKF